MMEERNSDISEDMRQSCVSKRCLVLAAGWIPCSYGFRQRGCLL